MALSDLPKPKSNWRELLLKAWSMRFLAVSMLAFGIQFAFEYTEVALWWPWSSPLLTAIGFVCGAFVAFARVVPQRNLPGEP